MKKITSTLLFLAFSFLSFAQTAFTEKTVNEMNQRLVKDPTAVFKNEVSPNYTLIGDNGKIFTYQDVLALFEQNNFANEYSDLKVAQHGNFGIATGISNHSFINKSSGKTIASYKVRFTYLHEFVNGKWQILSGQHSPIQATATKNKATSLKAYTAFNDRKVDDFANQFAPEYVDHTNPIIKGASGVKADRENTYKTWPDVKVKVEQMVAEGDWVMTRLICTATHTSEVMGVKPTQKKIEVVYWDCHHYNKDGLIGEGWNTLDNAALMQQLGLLGAKK